MTGFVGAQTRVTQFKQEDEMKWRKHEDRGPRGGRPQHSFILDPSPPTPRLLKNEQSIYILDPRSWHNMPRPTFHTVEISKMDDWQFLFSPTTNSLVSVVSLKRVEFSVKAWCNTFYFFLRAGSNSFSLPPGSYYVHSLLEAACAGNELQCFSRVPRCFFFPPNIKSTGHNFLQSHSEQLCQRFQVSEGLSKQS